MNRSLLMAAALLSSAAAAQYCIPNITNACSGTGYEFINNVSISNVNNPSGCVLTPAYTDYTGTVAPMQLAPGGVYPVSVSLGNAWSGDYVYLMLDADGDGAFVTAGEILTMLGPIPTTGGTQTLTGSITIPASVVPVTKLRVRMSYFTLPVGQEPCGTSTFGETEDYDVVTGGGPLVPEYQVNQPNCSHDIDGIQGNLFFPAQVSRCANLNFNVNLGSPLVGMPFDVLISPIALVPVSGGALWTGTQAVNINLAAFSWAFGGFTTPFFGSVSLPISLPSPVDLYTQMAIIDGSHVDGVSLSQPNGLHIIAGAGSTGFTPPTGDDSFTTLPSPTCFSFYGVSHSNAWITTNGRVGFGTTGSTSYYPSQAQAMTDNPFIGHWCDLNQGLGGTITMSNPGAGLTRFDWTAVPYYGSAVPNTFGIQYDGALNLFVIDGLAGIGVNPTLTFLGVSNGSLGSTDPGAVNYVVGGVPQNGTGTPGPNPGMVYNLGNGGSQTTGLAGIIYVWNAVSGNYDFVAY